MDEIVAMLAYVNPGTGSVIWQFLLLGIAGTWVTIRTYLSWAKGRVGRGKSTGKK